MKGLIAVIKGMFKCFSLGTLINSREKCKCKSAFGHFIPWVLQRGCQYYNLSMLSDIDECRLTPRNCTGDNEICVNKYGGFNCRCRDRFRRNPETKKCEREFVNNSLLISTIWYNLWDHAYKEMSFKIRKIENEGGKVNNQSLATL